MLSPSYSSSGASPVMLVEMLIDAAREAAWQAQQKRAAEAKARARKPRRPALTLRPGLDTPLWNELVKQIRPHLRKRGTKVQLARFLDLPRQRLQVCLKANSACLDAERTLLLVGWLGFFQRGGRIVSVVRPGRPRQDAKTAVLPENL